MSGSPAGGGSGSTNDLGGATLRVTGPSSGFPTDSDTVYATSGTDILTVSPNTTYTFSAWASGGPPTYPAMNLLVSEGSVRGTSIASSSFAFYTVSYSSGGAGDPHVGQPMRVQASLTAGVMWFGVATFTNMTLTVAPIQPKLTIRNMGAGQLQLLWPTNFTGFQLQSASDLVNSPWATVTNEIITQGTNSAVTQESPQAPQCFRLRMP